MRAGPVRRLVAALGLIAMAPLGYLLVMGRVTLPEAATRAGFTLLAVLVVSRLAGWGFNLLAGSIESSQWDGADRRSSAAHSEEP